MQGQESSYTYPVSYSVLILTILYESTKTNSTEFVQKLATNNNLLRDMLDACLRPNIFASRCQMVLNREVVNRAVELMTGLGSEFNSLLVDNCHVATQDQTCEIEEDIEYNIRTSYYTILSQDNLHYLHLLLFDSNPYETACGYLSRFLCPIIYNRPKDMIAFYVENPAVVAALAWHFHMKGVLEITCKIMEIELDYCYFERNKAKVVEGVLGKVWDGKGRGGYIGKEDEEGLEDINNRLENVLGLYSFFLEKNDDKYYSGKICKLLYEIEPITTQLLTELQTRFNSAQGTTAQKITDIAAVILKLDSSTVCYYPRKQSYNNCDSYDQSDKKPYYLSEVNILCISKLFETAIHKWHPHRPPTSIIITSFYKLTALFITVCCNRKLGNYFNTNFQQLLNYICYDIMLYPFNNILHIVIHKLYTKCFQLDKQYAWIFLQHTGFKYLWLKSFQKSVNYNIFEIHCYKLYTFVMTCCPYYVENNDWQLMAMLYIKKKHYDTNVVYGYQHIYQKVVVARPMIIHDSDDEVYEIDVEEIKTNKEMVVEMSVISYMNSEMFYKTLSSILKDYGMYSYTLDILRDSYHGQSYVYLNNEL